MDYPQAWAFVSTTKPEDHDAKCSWRATGGGLLCDCDVLKKEEARRTGRSWLRNEAQS